MLAEVHLLAANRCVGVERRTTLLDDVLVLGVRVEDRALVGDLGLELEGELVAVELDDLNLWFRAGHVGEYVLEKQRRAQWDCML